MEIRAPDSPGTVRVGGRYSEMSENERAPDFAEDAGNGDEIEILEVVGVDDQDPSGAGPGPAGEEEPEDWNEYVLDLDSPNGGILADPPENAPDSEPDPNSDRTRLVRLRADYDNLRKRIDREREEFELHANLSLVAKLLPVLDNLERALAVDSSDRSAPALHEGLIMIHKQLTDQLAEDGLQAIDALGQLFDPNLHDAVATEASSGKPVNTVVEEFQTGYLFRDRVLRPAMVKVTTDGEATETSPDEDAK